MAVAQSIVDIATEEARRHGETKIASLKLRLGRFSCVQKEPISFCFEFVAKGSPVEGARLIFEEVEARARCRRCNHEFTVDRAMFSCPACGSSGTDLYQGTECQLVEMEIDE